MKDRYTQHKEDKNQFKKFAKDREKQQDEKHKIESELDKEINGLAFWNWKVKKLWGKYRRKSFMDNLGRMTETMMLTGMGNSMEAMFAPTYLQCNCGMQLVPDGIYKEPKGKDAEEGIHQGSYETIKGQFVCLNCGRKYKLEMIEDAKTETESEAPVEGSPEQPSP
jgi:hypothetical protein